MKAAEGAKRPNFVLIFLDDSGWADFHPFGDPAYRTPPAEALARQGRVFHNFYVPQAVCSASRSALLTGCYPGNMKVFGVRSGRTKASVFLPREPSSGELTRREAYIRWRA
jgi:arylsulfatase A-like enzyme